MDRIPWIKSIHNWRRFYEADLGKVLKAVAVEMIGGNI